MSPVDEFVDKSAPPQSAAIDCPEPSFASPIPRGALLASVTFDVLGLPDRHFVVPQLKGVVWSKLVCRVLSLQSMLMSSLQLGGFSYAKTTCDAYTAIVVAQDAGREGSRDSYYIAMLFDPKAIAQVTTASICQWMRQLDDAMVQQLWDS
jgi:hypothetical protein